MRARPTVWRLLAAAGSGGLLAGLLLVTGSALARSSSLLPYPIAEVWPTAIRFLRVDRGATLREKDAESGYVLFDLTEGGKTYKGSFELVRTADSEGREATRVVANLPDLPRHFESTLLDKLALKVREEYGSPAPAPPRGGGSDPGRKKRPRRRNAPGPSDRRPAPAVARSAQLEEGGALLDGLPRCHVDPADAAVGGRFHRHLHLHRFQDDDGLSRGDGVANRYLDLPHGASDVGLDGRRHAHGRVGIVSGVVKGLSSPAGRARLRLAASGAALLAFCAADLPQVAAHAEFVPTLVNRYVSLTAFEARVDVMVSLLFGQLPAGERRRRMDLDRNGQIDPREVHRERLFWGQNPDRLVRFSVDGSPVRLTAAGVVDLNGDPGVAARPLLVTLHGSFDLSPGDRTIEVAGMADVERLGETEIALDIAAGWTLISSQGSAGRATGAAQRLFQFPGPRVAGGDLPRVTFSMRSFATGKRARPTWGPTAWAMLPVAALAILALAFLVARARRPPRQPPGAPH